MKTIFKIFVILVAAVLVGGLFYSAVTASSSTNQASASERLLLEGGDFNRPEKADGGELQLPTDSIKNLIIISVVGFIYLNLTKWLGRKKQTLIKISET